ncbi:aminoacyl-tRNA hydrolase [Candidatus Uhrbacteria bacterium]|nr:aminoacyl-tRNA hydrolase [Candidatus Uhrbacteria bacterium]
MKLIIGLGNPGKQYARTRHNAGWMALDLLAEKLGAFFASEQEFKAQIAKHFVADERVILAKPQTFMNLSGQAVSALMNFYKADINDLLVVHDDLDYAPGQMAFMPQGGAAGHNGISSIFELLGRQDFARLRIGIGRPENKEIKTEDWVLGGLNQETEKRILEAPEAIEDWITLGLQKAMTKWNAK